MAPNGRVSRGNTSDLVGLWNKLAASEAQPVRSRSRSPISGNLTTPNQFKFRKVSAFEPGTSSLLSPESARLETPHVRKTSALVLMPSSPLQSLAIDSATDEGSGSYRPRKTSAMSTLSVQVGYPLKSALKNSNTNLNQDQVSVIPTVVTSPPTDSKPLVYENCGRRGSGLGRSKSVKCNRVKFGFTEEEKNDGSSSKDYHKSSDSTLSPFDKFRSMDNKNIENSQLTSGRLTRQASLPSVSAPTSAPPPVDNSVNNNSNQTGSPTGPKRSIMSRSPSSTKELLLMWAQQRTNTYPNLNVTNFSTCWNDGMAFCALIHYYYPEAFDFEKLDPKNRRENFALAFKAAEDYAGICPLLDVEDMVMMMKPDWKCVFTYVQSFYRRFRNGRDPPPPVRTLTFTPDDDQVRPKEKPLSTEVQKSLLSKYMIDDEEDSRIKKRGISKGRPSTLSSHSFSFSSTRSSNIQTSVKSGTPEPAYLSKLNDLKSISLNRKSAEKDSCSFESGSAFGVSRSNIGAGSCSQLSIGSKSTESIQKEVNDQFSELQKKLMVESSNIASFALDTTDNRKSNTLNPTINPVDGLRDTEGSSKKITSKYSSEEKSVRSSSSTSSKKPPLPSLPPPSLPG